MAEESEDGQEKTEEPSQRKIEKAREDGKVLSSKELFVFSNISMALIVMFAFFLVAKQYLFEWADLFVFENDGSLDDLAAIKTTYALWFFLKVSLLVGTPVFLITIGTQLAVGGINFAPKAMAFKGSKLNPIKGMKNIISLKSLVELGKSILKVVLLMGTASYAIYLSLPQILQMPAGSISSALGELKNIFPLLLISSLIALAAIAAIDYFWQRHQHMDSLKMSRQEQKDEFKQTEGSPEVKQKIRQKQIQASMAASEQRKSVENVSNATAIITNPTHFAVALRYIVGEPGAPEVIAMGRGKVAQDIIEVGKNHRITTYRSPLLARALFFTSEIGKEISDKLYNAVAVALAYIYRIDRGELVEEPKIDLPEDMRFNENGQIIQGEE
ncbi:MAG: flagellar biosynthesis protein FlhB [Rhodobacteraceae bacterium]|nr:MAG: flagellar biosynthesis protein FlhB [Paracoccaceae bacterium]|tara:strand:+ start:91 stop:1248 length:1158 start_codon:yes stop_codon:yes gene_type:complete